MGRSNSEKRLQALWYGRLFIDGAASTNESSRRVYIGKRSDGDCHRQQLCCRA